MNDKLLTIKEYRIFKIAQEIYVELSVHEITEILDYFGNKC